MRRKYNRQINHKTAPRLHPTIRDIAWAAGIWEGEGSIEGRRVRSASLTISATQKDPWLLFRLRDLFGGGVWSSLPGRPILSRWQLSGPRAYGFILTIFSFLSPRRRLQARTKMGTL